MRHSQEEFGDWTLAQKPGMPAYMEEIIDAMISLFDADSPVVTQHGWDTEAVIEFCVWHVWMTIQDPSKQQLKWIIDFKQRMEEHKQ